MRNLAGHASGTRMTQRNPRCAVEVSTASAWRCEGSSILELLTSEDESLLIGWDSFLVLDLSLDILNSVSDLSFRFEDFNILDLY